MKVLILGGGGREHAIAWKLSQSTLCDKVYASPGNPGIAGVGECVAPQESSPAGWLKLAETLGAGLTIVGPEAPLAAGVADAFRAAGRRIIGPAAAAARLESSKVFAKEFMQRAGIPTAEFVVAQDAEQARRELDRFGFPVVVKADGLASGKGVVVAKDRAQAETALRELPAGAFVIEECLFGEEVSFIVYSEGERAWPFAPTQDHKALEDGDQGPNTGGMGAYCDQRILSDSETAQVMDSVIHPALGQMRAEGSPFTGFLYAGLMMTEKGMRVLEFNVRLGDPEAQPLMQCLETDLLATLLDGEPMRFSASPSVCVVMAAAGYPAQPRNGDLIEGIEDCGATVFHAGTRRTVRGLETAGGRVLGVTSQGATLAEARENVYKAVRGIRFDGMQFRRDIGVKGLRRW